MDVTDEHSEEPDTEADTEAGNSDEEGEAGRSRPHEVMKA